MTSKIHHWDQVLIDHLNTNSRILLSQSNITLSPMSQAAWDAASKMLSHPTLSVESFNIHLCRPTFVKMYKSFGCDSVQTFDSDDINKMIDDAKPSIRYYKADPLKYKANLVTLIKNIDAYVTKYLNMIDENVMIIIHTNTPFKDYSVMANGWRMFDNGPDKGYDLRTVFYKVYR